MISQSTIIAGISRLREAVSPRSAAEPDAGSELARQFEQVMSQADSSAIGAMSGKTDTHELVQSIAEAELALETAVAVRDKVVEAYQEILRMPV